MDLEALKFVGIGLCAFGFIGSAFALGKIFSSAFEAISRNPSSEPKISKYVFVAAGFIESMGLFSLVVVLMILFAS